MDSSNAFRLVDRILESSDVAINGIPSSPMQMQRRPVEEGVVLPHKLPADRLGAGDVVLPLLLPGLVGLLGRGGRRLLGLVHRAAGSHHPWDRQRLGVRSSLFLKVLKAD